MTNPPPPDPRSSKLGFDELIGIVVAFTAIGTILFWSLAQKDKNFNLNRLLPSSPTSGGTALSRPDAPQATTSPTTPPTSLPTLLPGESPSPEPTAPATPITPVNPTPATSQRTSGIVPFFPVPVPVSKAPAPAQPASPAPAKSTPVKAAPAAALVKLKDVPDNFWARPYIEEMRKRNIMSASPDGTFRPNGLMTRAEFASVLQRAFQDKPTETAPKFKDVPSGSSLSPAVKETAKTGFLRGTPNKDFLPTQLIPRAQVLVALANGLELKPPSSPEKILQTYQDRNQIPKYALTPVATATRRYR